MPSVLPDSLQKSRYWPELQAAREASRQACELLKRHFDASGGGEGSGVAIQKKSDHSWVSEVDRKSEEIIKTVLSNSFPNDPIMGEEQGLQSSGGDSGGRLWVVDPLDGTTNYLRGFPFFATSIALSIDGLPVVGLVEAPALGWRFEAVQGAGAFLNGRPIHVSATQSLEDSLLATGFFFTNFPVLDEGISIFRNLVPKTAGIRRAGAAALDLCLVAKGVFDGFWEKGIKAWDLAAGAIIVQEAGGVVTKYDGSKMFIDSGEIFAVTPGLEKLLRENIKPGSPSRN
jgi:myo-inositol-1(or 4)-monophosphatase